MALEHSIIRDYNNHLTSFLGLNIRERLDLMTSLPPSSFLLPLLPPLSHTQLYCLSLTEVIQSDFAQEGHLGEGRGHTAGVHRVSGSSSVCACSGAGLSLVP